MSALGGRIPQALSVSTRLRGEGGKQEGRGVRIPEMRSRQKGLAPQKEEPRALVELPGVALRCCAGIPCAGRRLGREEQEAGRSWARTQSTDRRMRRLLIAWDFRGESDFYESAEMEPRCWLSCCSHGLGVGLCVPLVGIWGKSRNFPSLLSFPSAFLVLLCTDVVLNAPPVGTQIAFDPREGWVSSPSFWGGGALLVLRAPLGCCVIRQFLLAPTPFMLFFLTHSAS